MALQRSIEQGHLHIIVETISSNLYDWPLDYSKVCIAHKVMPPCIPLAQLERLLISAHQTWVWPRAVVTTIITHAIYFKHCFFFITLNRNKSHVVSQSFPYMSENMIKPSNTLNRLIIIHAIAIALYRRFFVQLSNFEIFFLGGVTKDGGEGGLESRFVRKGVRRKDQSGWEIHPRKVQRPSALPERKSGGTVTCDDVLIHCSSSL